MALTPTSLINKLFDRIRYLLWYQDSVGRLIQAFIPVDSENGLPVGPNNPLFIGIGDGAFIDAYGRLRVSNPHMLLDSTLDYDKRAALWDETHTLTYNTGVGGLPVAGETVTSTRGSDEATGIIVSFTGDATSGVLTIRAVLGVFVENEQIVTGGTFDADVNFPGGVVKGVHDANARCYDMTLGTASGEKITRQTYVYWPYRSGQSQLISMTFRMNVAKANLDQRVGYFDDDNGLLLQQLGTALRVVLRSSTSGSMVPAIFEQADWSEDTLDGSGDEDNPSGRTIDVTKVNNLTIDLQWLGSGRVRYYFDFGDTLLLFHEDIHANTNAQAYMGSAALPARYEIENVGVTVGASTLKQISTAVVREGGGEVPGFVYAQDNHDLPRSVTTVHVGLVGIRLKSTHIRSVIKLLHAEMLNEGTTTTHWEVNVNPTLSGTPPVWVSANPHSVVEFSTGAGVVLDDQGRLVLSGYAPGTSGGKGSAGGGALAEAVLAAANIDGTPQEIWLSAKRVSGTEDVFGSLHWQELR